MTGYSFSKDTRIIRDVDRNLDSHGAAAFITRRWLELFLLAFGVVVAVPFLAPLFMHLGWDAPAAVIYTIYSFLCHQLPERSYFLFGEKATYSLAEIQSAWQNTNNPLILRRFIGSPLMGWKVAWSDRMISLYGGIWIAAVLWGLLRRRIAPLGWRGLVLLSLPIAVDGLTHLVSDLAGIGLGFRDSNLWLVTLTGKGLPAAFYAGDAWGSFNSIMRLLTGFLFGLGVVWFCFPHLHSALGIRKKYIGENPNGNINF